MSKLKYDYIPVNEKIEYCPLVLCYRLFIPVKNKTGIIGLWRDRAGKVYRDSIKIETYGLIWKDLFKLVIGRLFKDGQKAVFYKNPYNEAVIEYQSGQREILKHRIAYIERHIKAGYVKALLSQHGGLTIYRVDRGYLIEIYK